MAGSIRMSGTCQVEESRRGTGRQADKQLPYGNHGRAIVSWQPLPVECAEDDSVNQSVSQISLCNPPLTSSRSRVEFLLRQVCRWLSLCLGPSLQRWPCRTALAGKAMPGTPPYGF